MAKSTEEIKGIIKELGDTQWSKDNEAQGKAVQLLKGLAFSDEPIANKFMEALDKASSSIASKLLGGKVIEEWTDNGKPESKKEKEIVAKLSKLDIGEVMKLQMKAFKDKDKDMMIATMNRMAELEADVKEWEDDVIEETKALPVGLLHCDHFLGGDLMEEEKAISVNFVNDESPSITIIKQMKEDGTLKKLADSMEEDDVSRRVVQAVALSLKKVKQDKVFVVSSAIEGMPEYTMKYPSDNDIKIVSSPNELMKSV